MFIFVKDCKNRNRYMRFGFLGKVVSFALGVFSVVMLESFLSDTLFSSL